ncbi:MAG: Gfo/Idh/MocA family oxidoreductase [Limisphaerales bacterium]
MNSTSSPGPLNDLDRRSFVQRSSFAAMLAALGAVELRAQAQPAPEKKAAFTVNVAVIGLGPWGREIINALGRVKEAKIVAICDTYAAMVRRTAENAPGAAHESDYKKVLADKNVQAVVIATPTHQHRRIVLDALAAGKHVYCEAPLAHTVDDARAIARAAKNTPTAVFQAGLQLRSDTQRHFLLQFVRSGALGRNIFARAQWHKKQSWRKASPNAEREREINWHLRQEQSAGLVGEIGIHQVDNNSWFLKDLPVAVTGFGGVLQWADGRTVPDTAQCVFEYGQGVNFIYDVSLANSFDSDYEMIYGTDAAVMMRGTKAWMFKESDAPLLGWEVYARKDNFHKETGIALVANATKLVAQGDQVEDNTLAMTTSLQSAMESFLTNVNEVGNAVEDFKAAFGDADKAALIKHLLTVPRQPGATAQDGFEATVSVLKAGEAVAKKSRIVFAKEWFQV